MPLAQISMRAGKPPAWRRALLDGLYDALREAMDVPEGDRFAVLHELPPENFDQGPAFGIERSQDLVYIRIALFDTRPVAQKQALFRALVDRLGRDPGLRPEDVFIVLEPIAKENWSVGRGDMQFAPGRPSHG